MSRLVLGGPGKWQEMSSYRAFCTPGLAADRFLLVAVTPDVPEDKLQEDWIAPRRKSKVILKGELRYIYTHEHDEPRFACNDVKQADRLCLGSSL